MGRRVTVPRGGKREGAGRKTQWASGCKFIDTTTIRVPCYLQERLLAIAHDIDAGQDIHLLYDIALKRIAKLEAQLKKCKK